MSQKGPNTPGAPHAGGFGTGHASSAHRDSPRHRRTRPYKRKHTTVRAGELPKDRSGKKKRASRPKLKRKKRATGDAQWQGETAGATARELRARAHRGWRTQQTDMHSQHARMTSEKNRTPPGHAYGAVWQTPPAQCCPQATQNRFQPLSHVHTLAKDSGIPHTSQERKALSPHTHTLPVAARQHHTPIRHTLTTPQHPPPLLSLLSLSPPTLFSLSLFLLFLSPTCSTSRPLFLTARGTPTQAFCKTPSDVQLGHPQFPGVCENYQPFYPVEFGQKFNHIHCLCLRARFFRF